jgi:hypothetical protein
MFCLCILYGSNSNANVWFSYVLLSLLLIEHMPARAWNFLRASHYQTNPFVLLKGRRVSLKLQNSLRRENLEIYFLLILIISQHR